MSGKTKTKNKKRDFKKIVTGDRKARNAKRRRHDFAGKTSFGVTVEGTFAYSGRGFGFCIPDEDYGRTEGEMGDCLMMVGEFNIQSSMEVDGKAVRR